MEVDQLKFQATLLGKMFAEKGIMLSPAEELNFAPRFDGARAWQTEKGRVVPKLAKVDHWEHRLTISFRSVLKK